MAERIERLEGRLLDHRKRASEWINTSDFKPEYYTLYDYQYERIG
jgi:hypothetical protein